MSRDGQIEITCMGFNGGDTQIVRICRYGSVWDKKKNRFLTVVVDGVTVGPWRGFKDMDRAKKVYDFWKKQPREKVIQFLDKWDEKRKK